MKTQDICLDPPRTQYEAWMRRMNNMQAQWIGLSQFSKTIDVKTPFTELEILQGWKGELYPSTIVSNCCGYSSNFGGDELGNTGYCRGCKDHCLFVKEKEYEED